MELSTTSRAFDIDPFNAKVSKEFYQCFEHNAAARLLHEFMGFSLSFALFSFVFSVAEGTIETVASLDALWQFELLTFARMARRKLGTITKSCIVKTFYQFFQCFSPSCPAT